MKKIMTIIGVFGMMVAQAQVGINTDTPQATLDIKSDATKALKITNTSNTEMVTVMDDGKVGIGTATPTEKLEVAGSVKIVDGTQGAGKVLVSDANGKASWKNVAQYTVKGTIPATAVSVPAVIDATGQGAIAYTGCYITLPAGSWTIKATTWLSAGGSDLVLPVSANQSFASVFISTSSTANVPPTYISDIKSIIINPLYQAGVHSIDFYGTGEIPIELTSPQTIYLWGYISKRAWSPYPTATPDITKASFWSYNLSKGAYGPYTQFYAVPINYSN